MLIEKEMIIRNMNIKSRIVMPPMATAKSAENGYVTEELISYYEDRAKNSHLDLIIAEHGFVSKQGKASFGQLSYAEDGAIEGLKKLTDGIHKTGVKVVAQINHAGSATAEAVTGQQLVSASEVANPGMKEGMKAVIPHALTEEEIQSVEDDFVKAAVRAKKAGFDGVEIHCAHGYFLNQFYSPMTNKREDAYGGTVENRLRMTLEIVKKVRAELGDYPIFVRLGGCDYLEGGSTIADAVEAGKLLEAAGVDLIDLTGGMCRFMRKDNTAPGYFSDMSEAVKKEVSIPVLVTGGITTLAQAEELLQEEKADLIGVGRALLANAKWEM